jgi:hypothetical protein
MNSKLIAKAIKVISSCKTIEQLKVAKHFAKLALKSSVSPAYKIIVEFSEEFHIAADLIDESYKDSIRKLI